MDDHPIFRKGLTMSLEEIGDLTVCGEGASGTDALTLARDLQYDVVLLDLSMPDGGLAILPALCRENANSLSHKRMSQQATSATLCWSQVLASSRRDNQESA